MRKYASLNDCSIALRMIKKKMELSSILFESKHLRHLLSLTILKLLAIISSSFYNTTFLYISLVKCIYIYNEPVIKTNEKNMIQLRLSLRRNHRDLFQLKFISN